MANDWIPVRTTLPQCREVALIAAACKEDPDLVVGRLIRFWAWLDAETADGRLPGMTLETLALALRMPHEFFQAVAKVGWLTVTPDGLEIPNWDRWFAQSSKKRLQAAVRMASARTKPADNQSVHALRETRTNAQQKANNSATEREQMLRCERTNVAQNANKSATESEQKRNHRTEQNRREYTYNDDDDDDVKGEKGGVGEKGGPPPEPKALYEAHACIWPNRRIHKKRDRILLWRVSTLAALGHTWAQVALDALADAKPENPGAYLQRLVFELGPRDPHVGLILGEISVPSEITNPRPPSHGPPQSAEPNQEKPLSPEEGRAMVREVLAILKPGFGNGNGKKTLQD